MLTLEILLMQVAFILTWAKWNTYLAQSVSRSCKCMQFLFNSLMFTTLLTKKHDQVALLIDSAFTWSS